MRTKEKVVLGWSGGKDSILALYHINQLLRHDVVALVTSIIIPGNHVSTHRVPVGINEQQAASLNIPLVTVRMNANPSNQEYVTRLNGALETFRGGGVHTVAYGDLFLQGIRKFRDSQLKQIRMQGLYPLWGRNTRELAQQFIDLGFKAIVVCVDTTQLSAEFVGRSYDTQFLADLPEGIDLCGENGEFHTFVYDGPLLDHPIDFKVTDKGMVDDRFAITWLA